MKQRLLHEGGWWAALTAVLAVIAVTLSTGGGTPGPALAQEGGADKVQICHYDRNLQGPNAGPHVIEIDDNAVEQHLANHTKTNDFLGDDFVIGENGKTIEDCVLDGEEDDTKLVIMKECTGGVTGSFDIQLSGDVNQNFTLACGASTDPIDVEATADLMVSETTTGFDTSFRGACDGDGSVILVEDTQNTCVVSNGPLADEDDTTLVITKECVGGVTGGSFDIELSGDVNQTFTLGCGTSTDPIDVEADDSLTVVETTTGFETSYRGACDGDGSVILVADTQNTCVVSNGGLTTLTIQKECVEGVTSADGPFNFELTGTINDTFSIAECGGTHMVEGVNADDTGVLTETNTGFEVSIRGDCDGDGTLLLIENDDNVCVVTNAPLGDEDETTLVITKECTGGVTGGSFDIELSGEVNQSFTLGCDTSTDPIDVDADDTLTVSETTTGFDTSFRGACDGDGSVILVEDTQNVCVVSNAELTTLTILKECVGDVTSEDGPFNFELTGSINDTFSIAECGGTHEVVGVNADDTGVLVETNTGFEVSIRGDCDGDGTLLLIENDDNVCVVTNGTPADGEEETTLLINKECGAGVTGTFTLNVLRDDVIIDTVDVDCDSTSTAIGIEADDTQLTVEEVDDDGFEVNFRGVCDGDGSVVAQGQPGGIEEGEANICVVTNNLIEDVDGVVDEEEEEVTPPTVIVEEEEEIPTIVISPQVQEVQGVTEEAVGAVVQPQAITQPEAAVLGVQALPDTGSGGLADRSSSGIEFWQLLAAAVAGLSTLGLGIWKFQAMRS